MAKYKYKVHIKMTFITQCLKQSKKRLSNPCAYDKFYSTLLFPKRCRTYEQGILQRVADEQTTGESVIKYRQSLGPNEADAHGWILRREGMFHRENVILKHPSRVLRRWP